MVNFSNKENLVKSAAFAAVLTALTIMLLKIYGWYITKSQSLLASLIDSSFDISASLLNLIVIKLSLRPADKNHRFGHNKFEDLAIFSQSIFFSISGIFTIFSSTKILFYEGIKSSSTLKLESNIAINLMYVCFALTFILVYYQNYVIRKTNSTIIIADRLHYFTDCIANIIVITTLHLSDVFWYLDSLSAIFISIYILYSSYQLFKVSSRNLVDQELSKEDQQKIIAIVKQFPEIVGLHQLKTRHAGNKSFIQFHLEMDGNITLYYINKLLNKIERKILITFPSAEIIIHPDPKGVTKNTKYREKI